MKPVHLAVASCLALLAFTGSAATAQSVNPQAKELFTKALQAVDAKDFKGAVESLRQANAADQTVWQLPDNGKLDQIVSGLKAQAEASQQDAALGKNLAWIYFVKGMQQESLKEYRRVAGLGGKDPEVEQNIKTLEAWQSGGGGSSGGSSSGGSGDSGSGGSSGSQSTAASPAPNTGGEEAGQLKETIKKKDEEIANLQKEKEDLQKKIDELEKSNKELQLYKTQLILKQGGLR
ncbi:MAG: hypothetical protein HY815_32930 [Candidatus Riflebacteria bacterium]|nr:hypothetical protein [Candidatus Riflebacteria bacterium]